MAGVYRVRLRERQLFKIVLVVTAANGCILVDTVDIRCVKS